MGNRIDRAIDASYRGLIGEEPSGHEANNFRRHIRSSAQAAGGLILGNLGIAFISTDWEIDALAIPTAAVGFYIFSDDIVKAWENLKEPVIYDITETQPE